MSAAFRIKIITPERTVLDETVEFLSVQTVEGSLGILPHHTPLIASLNIAPLHYMKGGQTEYAAVMGGLLKVEDNQVVLLTPAAERGEYSKSPSDKLRDTHE